MITFTSEQDNVTNKAVTVFGVDSNIWITIEEMAELNNAIAKRERGRATVYDIEEEIADVFVSLQVLSHCFNADNIQSIVNKKMQRLSERVTSKDFNKR